ncbi:tRNA-specific 2-thiouridylase [Candidatus Saccharibacteria bacterium]|nr:tRNA-specific 2-thiouridylase [Candidatus Saccharibacteria bacterium]
MKTVYVGMSGGVDSSVSALLLKEQGYHVVGIYMKNWSKDLPGMKCPWAEDLADAKRVAVKLGIDFQVWDFEESYREKVVEYMLREFRAGNTPNPDIMCNQEIKFKLFYEQAMKEGADFIATGHYARVRWNMVGHHFSGPANPASMPYAGTRAEPPLDNEWKKPSEDERGEPVRSVRNIHLSRSNRKLSRENDAPTIYPQLARAIDENKDQTYFLYRISEEALAHTIFPIGVMRKPEVKKLAQERGLHNAYKKESMGVCFVGEVGMKDFLKEYIDVQPGEIREAESNQILGYHEGAVFYTIGQRHGLYLNGEKGVVNDGMPYYVVKKDAKNNIIYVSKNLNHAAMWAKELTLKDVFIRRFEYDLSRDSGGYDRGIREPSPVTTGARNPDPKKDMFEALANKRLLVRLRHRMPLIPATFDGKTLRFEEEVKRPASGQSAVLYDGEVCLGGGIIA